MDPILADLLGQSLSYRPTSAMARQAARGLELRVRFGRGGTYVGVAMAEGLVAGIDMPLRDVRRMWCYFARHAVDKRTGRRLWGDEADPSAGYVAWLLWGGEPGREWAEGIGRLHA